MKIKLKGPIREMTNPITAQSGKTYSKLVIAHEETGPDGKPNGEQTEFEVIVFGQKEELVQNVDIGDRYELTCWLNSRKSESENYKGYNLSLALHDIKQG